MHLYNNSDDIYVGNSESMNIIDFYNIKLNDIFSSFFIKYFIKLTSEFSSIRDYQQFLYNINNNKSALEKGLTFFDIYIEKKYELNYDDLNTAVNIYIKESLSKLLNKKSNYKKEKDILTKLFYKLFKSLAQYLYEHPNDISNSVEYQKALKKCIRYEIYDIIPLKYTIKHYDTNNNYDTVQENVQEQKHLQHGGNGMNDVHALFHETDTSSDNSSDNSSNKEMNINEEKHYINDNSNEKDLYYDKKEDSDNNSVENDKYIDITKKND